MMEAKPASLHQLANLPGVGERKLKLYGEQFLAVIKAFAETRPGKTETAAATLELFRLGYSVPQIARQRNLQETTIYGHLAQGLEQGQVALREVVELPESVITQIEDALLNLPEDQKNSLKPAYELFEGAYSYGVLRCIRAALQYRTN